MSQNSEKFVQAPSAEEIEAVYRVASYASDFIERMISERNADPELFIGLCHALRELEFALPYGTIAERYAELGQKADKEAKTFRPVL